MARPRDSTALKVAKGRSHLTKAETAEGLENEVYAASGELKPPTFLKGIARKHFKTQAEYMEAVNRIAGVQIYGAVDAHSLALMSVSYQKSIEYLTEEQNAKGAEAKDRASRKRVAEERAYREFAKMLKLDPGNRVDIKPTGAGDADEQPEF